MEKKQVTLSNNETYAYLEKGKGKKDLILIHGNFSSSVWFKPLFDELGDDYHMIAMDLRGYGDSTYKERITSLKDFADDVALFMDELNIEHADVAGWSLGGGVAMQFAATYPEKTDKLVLISSASHKGYPVFKKDENNQILVGEVYDSPEEMAKDPLQVAPLLQALQANNFDFVKQILDMTIYTVTKPSEEEYDLYIGDSLKQRNLPDADFALASFNMSHEKSLYSEGSGDIDKIDAECLHIWGENDATVPEHMVKDNVRAIEDSTYIKYENCGHAPLVDKPKRLADDVRSFLEK